MSQQSDINSDVATLAAAAVANEASLTAIEAEIAALKVANPALDLTALDAAVAQAKTDAAALSAVAPPPAPPTPPAA